MAGSAGAVLAASPPSVEGTLLPTAEEAAAILAAALRGEADLDPAWQAAAGRVAAALSEGERAALTSGPPPADAALLRAAAGLRLRLELAIAAVPARGDGQGSVFPALLGEVDAFLLQLKAAAPVKAPGAADALEPVRLALVDGGVALAGALDRAGAAAPVEPLPAAAAPPEARPAPRVLSNVSAAQAASAAGRGGKGLWVALGLAAALAAGYHGYGLATRRPPALPPTLPGAPANTFVIRQGASVVLRLQPGAAVDAGELERFTAQERARGNAVRSLASGVWAIQSAAAEGAKEP
jgi:hypothetical protein